MSNTTNAGRIVNQNGYVELTVRVSEKAANSLLRVLLKRNHKNISNTVEEALALEDRIVSAITSGSQIIERNADQLETSITFENSGSLSINQS